jgi:hypothetical protein
LSDEKVQDKKASFISRLTLFAMTDLIKQEKPNFIQDKKALVAWAYIMNLEL